MRYFAALAGVFVVLVSSIEADQLKYQTPSPLIEKALNAAPPPQISISPRRDSAVLLESVAHPSISELAEPMERLAGLRIDVHTNGPHLLPHNTSFELVRLPSGSPVPLTLPEGERKLSAPIWSPDGKRFAFTNTTPTSIDLWIADTATGKAQQVKGIRINWVIGEALGGPGAFGRTRPPVDWLADNRTLLVRIVPPDRGEAPKVSDVPKGPNVQESAGHSGPVRTYEDMLSSPHDEDLFDYYARAQLALVDADSAKTTPVGEPGIFTFAQASPDGANLLVAHLKRPYSYLHPYAEFPTDIEVWNRSGAKLRTIASLPLADRIPIDGVRTGPRNYRWMPRAGSSIVWVEAMDGGNPKEKAKYRERLMTLAAPFEGEPKELGKLEQRFRGMEFLEDGTAALVEDYDRDRRWLRTFSLDLKAPEPAPKLLFERNAQDRYSDPGQAITRMTGNGEAVQVAGDYIFLTGLGSTPQGDRPFIDRLDMKSGKKERLFQSAADVYDQPLAVLDASGKQILLHHESPADPPNYFVLEGTGRKAISHYANPVPELAGVTKQLVKYKRADGVQLSFTLYLPPGYQKGTKLPTFLWAYPYEYNDAGTAGQVSGSSQRFTQLIGHQLLLLGGYALLENAAMPIIGDPETVNNTYLEQIVSDAKAAIDKAAEMGVTDPDRVAVGGHSYGAFMTGNLLAHSKLFRAGIAESGAYNRTLTPFGFQSERRTLWEAPDLYIKMSPLMAANEIKAPLLLIHGEADDNAGTFPINSERLYQAVRGNGGTVRLVMLPLEAHGYASKETLGHVLWEEQSWLDRFVKNAEKEPATSN